MDLTHPQWSTDPAQQFSLLMVASVLCLLCLAVAGWRAWTEKHPWPLFVFLGAGCALIYEPLGDVLSKVAYPSLDPSVFTVFGRTIPVWMVPNYFFFMGLPVLLLLRYVVRPGVSAQRWWGTYAGLVLAVGLFEQPGIAASAWKYFDPIQAFSVNTYPIWVAFANAQALFVMSFGVRAFRSVAPGKTASAALVLIVPGLLAASHAGVSLPVSSAMYGTTNLAIINIAALVTIGACILAMWFCHAALSAEARRSGHHA